jgi:hypothetical protein
MGLDQLISILLGLAALAAVMIGVSFLPAFPKLSQTTHRWIVGVSAAICIGCVATLFALYLTHPKASEAAPVPSSATPVASSRPASTDVPSSNARSQLAAAMADNAPASSSTRGARTHHSDSRRGSGGTTVYGVTGGTNNGNIDQNFNFGGSTQQ